MADAPWWKYWENIGEILKSICENIGRKGKWLMLLGGSL